MGVKLSLAATWRLCWKLVGRVLHTVARGEPRIGLGGNITRIGGVAIHPLLVKAQQITI